MRRFSCLLALLMLLSIAGCGGGSSNTNQNVGLFGNWNVVMDSSSSQTPVYVFGLALSQAGTNYSGGSIAYTGSTPAPTNMCINGNTLRATATTNGNDFTLTITDTSTTTTIVVNGSLTSSTGTLSGTYSNPASGSCPASQGSVAMSPQ